MSDSYSDEQPAKAGIDSPNATRFQSSDAPDDKQDKFEQLWLYNENLKRDRNNTNSEEVRRREQSHILDSISSSLELPEYQHKEARKIVEQTNFTEEVEGQYLSLETYCFGICVLVHNQNVRRFTDRFLPQKYDEKNPDIFVSVQNEIDISDEKLEQALSELHEMVVRNV